MNHFFVHFEYYLQGFCPTSDFFWSQTQSKNVESVRSFPSFQSLRSFRRWGQKLCGRGRVTRAGNRDDGSMQWQTPSNESLSCSLWLLFTAFLSKKWFCFGQTQSKTIDPGTRGAAADCSPKARLKPYFPAHVPRMTWVAQGKLPQIRTLICCGTAIREFF